MTTPRFDDDELDAAIAALSDPDRFREAESMVAAAAPKLQKVLNDALAAGGWFDETHSGEALKAATKPDPEERLTAVKTLIAEETRIGMMVGVAVGWALAAELGESGNQAYASSENSETEPETGDE